MNNYKKDITRISPSAILNYYFPMDNQIPQDVLEKAGIRGNIIHSAIEEFLIKNPSDLGEITEKVDINNLISENDKKNVSIQFKNFMDNYGVLELGNDKNLEDFIELEKIRCYVDYHDEKQIIDWKTNSVLGKKEIEKYELQLNIYRYMVFKKYGKKIENLKIVHLKKNEKLTPTGKVRNLDMLLKVHECKNYDFDYIENIIDIVYNALILEKSGIGF